MITTTTTKNDNNNNNNNHNNISQDIGTKGEHAGSLVPSIFFHPPIVFFNLGKIVSHLETLIFMSADAAHFKG